MAKGNHSDETESEQIDYQFRQRHRTPIGSERSNHDEGFETSRALINDRSQVGRGLSITVQNNDAEIDGPDQETDFAQTSPLEIAGNANRGQIIEAQPSTATFIPLYNIVENQI